MYSCLLQVRLESSEQLLPELPLSPEQLQPYPTHEVLVMRAPAEGSEPAPITALAVHRDGHWLASGAFRFSLIMSYYSC